MRCRRRPTSGFVWMWLALSPMACGQDPAEDAPRPTAVEPPAGYPTQPTVVVIRGQGFLARPSQPSGGGTPSIVSSYRAWLGEAELASVTWMNDHTLRATVPANLPLGTYALTVEDALGQRGRLDDAYAVLAPPALGAAGAVDRPTVSVGQDFTVSLTVANAGGADVTDLKVGAPSVSSSGGAGSTLTAGPGPDSPTRLAPGQSGTLVWTFRATAPGTLEVTAEVSGTDALSSATLTAAPSAPVKVVIQRPAELSARVEPSRSQVSMGQTVVLAVTVENGGGASAAGVRVSIAAPATFDPNPVGAPPAEAWDLPGGGSRVLAWTYRATAAGTGVFGVSAAGADANGTGGLAAAASTRPVLVQRGAALAVVLVAAPATVSTGQAFTAALTVTNVGDADAIDVAPTAPAPFSSDGASAGLASGPTPGSAASLLPGRSQTFTWICSARSAGHVVVSAAGAGRDGNSGGALTSGPASAEVLIQDRAALRAQIELPVSVRAGRSFTVTMTVANAGGAGARNVMPTPLALSPAGTGVAELQTGPTPPAATVPGGGAATFTWTYAAKLKGTLQVAGGAAGLDANDGLPTSAPVVVSNAMIVR